MTPETNISPTPIRRALWNQWFWANFPEKVRYANLFPFRVCGNLLKPTSHGCLQLADLSREHQREDVGTLTRVPYHLSPKHSLMLPYISRIDISSRYMVVEQRYSYSVQQQHSYSGRSLLQLVYIEMGHRSGVMARTWISTPPNLPKRHWSRASWILPGAAAGQTLKSLGCAPIFLQHQHLWCWHGVPWQGMLPLLEFFRCRMSHSTISQKCFFTITFGLTCD